MKNLGIFILGMIGVLYIVLVFVVSLILLPVYAVNILVEEDAFWMRLVSIYLIILWLTYLVKFYKNFGKGIEDAKGSRD